MKKLNTEEWIAEWLKLDRDDPQYITLRMQILESGISEEELAELERLDHALENLPRYEPSTRLNEQFYRQLDKETASIQKKTFSLSGLISRFDIKPLLKPALVFTYSLTLIIMGWWIGKGTASETNFDKLGSDLAEMKQMMTFTMLNQSSSTERIRAIRFISGMNGWDNQTYTVLFDIVNDDSNVNVRLVALDALLHKVDNSAVREGLIHALQRQHTPLMQLYITDALLKYREQKALPQFRRMLMQKDLNYRVRNRLVEAIKILI